MEYNKKEKTKADESYISENCPFKVGDKVKMFDETGIISKIIAENDGRFSAKWKKYKPDGKKTYREESITIWQFDKFLKKA